jgi:hypothetical protein
MPIPNNGNQPLNNPHLSSSLSSPGSYKYYRFLVKDVQGYQGGVLFMTQISEVQLIGFAS